MRVLVVHPEMGFLGGGERLCCDTIRALSNCGHEITLLSSAFDRRSVETFFGQERLFDKVNLLLYPPGKGAVFGTCSHLIHHLRNQEHVMGRVRKFPKDSFDLVFSTQDAGYIPDVHLPVIQWGLFPRIFPKDFANSWPKTVRSLPLRLHYNRKISRIGLVLAISQYSKWHFDTKWKRPSTLVYPACNMVAPREKRQLIVTVARAVPVKRLELFWTVARLRSEYEFAMLITKDPRLPRYSLQLSKQSPGNGRTIFNPSKEIYHKYLGEAKVYLHLMEGEHFGITIVEAMSAACVPIVHDSGGPKEIVDRQMGFRWRSIEDVPAMIDEAMGKSPSTVARRQAENFSHEVFESRISAIFSELRV